MTIDRVRVNNAGGPGGTASTNFYFTSALSPGLTALSAFYTAIKAYYPSTITMQVPNSGDQVDETNGRLTGSWSASGGTNVTGTGTGIQATPVGLEVAWLGTGVVDNHRPVGKTLLVPVAPGAFSTSGIVAPAVLTTINTAASTFLSAAGLFVIWHRPVYNRKVTPPVLTRPGTIMTVASGVCRSAPTVLRSRRQ